MSTVSVVMVFGLFEDPSAFGRTGADAWAPADAFSTCTGARR
jgi:hypothetical protein